MEGEPRLVYDCTKVKSQVSDGKGIITLRRNAMNTLRSLPPENIVLKRSILRAIQNQDYLRVEELVVEHECAKLIVDSK